MRNTTGLACVAVAAVALAGEPASAQVSHQGQNIIDHVVLRDGNPSGRGSSSDVCQSASFKDKALFRVSPDGTQASEPFMVPAGRLLVITDVEWTVDATSGGFSLTPGWSVRTSVRIGSGATLTRVFLSRTVQVGAESAPVSASEQLTTGFVIAPNTAICPSSTVLQSNGFVTARLFELILRGYLIDNTH
jgi:hypothetical protein